MAKIIAIVNQKGGVGKTTSCVNLTAALRQRGARTLLCDFDPQANATSGMGVDKGSAPNVYDLLVRPSVDPKNAVASTPYGDVLPSNKALAGAGIELIALDRREYRLKDALDKLSADYDYIFIDCPPFSGASYPQCPVRCRLCSGSCAVRILRVGRPQRLNEHHSPHEAGVKPLA